MKRPALSPGWLPGALLAGAVAAVLLAPNALLRGYLIAWLCTLNLALGAMMVLLIATLSRAHWVDWIAAPLRAAAATLPALALLTLPLWLNLDALFPWVKSDSPWLPGDGTPAQRWLQPAWLVWRSAAMLVIWLVVAAAMELWPLRRPLAVSPRRAAVGLMVLLLTISLFAVDWIMALVEHHKTTMIGFLLVSEQWLAALALGALWLATQPEFSARAGRDIGNLLLAAAMFFGYCLFMDYLIVWQANLPHEIAGYLRRESRLMVAIVPLSIAAPIALLLLRAVKRRAAALGAVAGLLLLGHLLMVCWLLSPLFRAEGASLLQVWDAPAALLILGAWLWLFILLSRLSAAGEARR